MSRKTVSMIGNLTRDMMSDVMETSLKKPIQTGEFRKNPVEPAWRCPAEYIYELVKTEQFVMEYLKPKQAVTGRVEGECEPRQNHFAAARRRVYRSDEKYLPAVCG